MPTSFATYQWNTTGCYTHPMRNSGNASCFPDGQTTQSVTDDDVTAEDAGTIICVVTINGVNYTSEPFTLRISGEELVYYIIARFVLYTMYTFITCYMLLLYYASVVIISIKGAYIHFRYFTYWSNAWW